MHLVSHDRPPPWVLDRRRALGDQLRAARLQANLTQEALGELAEVDRQSVNRIEQGHQAPRLDTLIRLADALQADIGLVFRQPPSGPPADDPA
ncbi:helix-turn-helix transcriptional regulator [Streptomyces sp. TRM 70351]|uniref:helix-turn-helix transcriptional regulator n=1 Tax=Streptomyces sp. TRM 70351 TaxID=3116552 RepID=UPI002E7BD4F5|nr:helix-turn-helix transcriptional regulator [Streptomyces sp. TRM 70351]MEE1927354.1 helix-turn-helix transcriptional regulator [Streptomyces sp. TRM 70351]